MGAYLAFGLNYRASVLRSQLQPAGWDEAKMLQLMMEEIDFPADNYGLIPAKEKATWELRPEVLGRHLIPLLERVYPLLYPKSNKSGAWWTKFTQELASMPPEEWISWAKSTEDNWEFQVEWEANEWYSLQTPAGQEVNPHFYNIRLMMEGKFRMEEYQQSFHFLQHCISRAFPENPLSRSLRIYVLG